MIAAKKIFVKSSLSLIAGLLLMSGSTAVAQDAVEGKKVFEANCTVCHSIEADIVGPALKDVHKRRGDEWLVKFIQNSQELVKSGDKDAVEVFEKFHKVPMPSFAGTLSEEDITNVIAYIKEASDVPAAAAAAPVTTGDDQQSDMAMVTPSELVGEEVGFLDLPPVLLFTFVLAGAVVLLIVVVLVTVFRLFVPMLGDSIYKEEFRSSFAGRVLFLMRGDTTLVTGKARDEIHSHHDFDGIQEYDNDLPPWWKTMFYATIVFAIGYMLHFHVFKTGALQAEEYEMEMEQAAILAAMTPDDPNAVTDYEVMTDATALENGKQTYIQNCAACHGQNAEGTVGPNLTDEYWLHGGDVNDIFKTIKYGVPAKGMVPWQGKLTKDEILEVSSYILSLQGSNPENGKEPQGEKE
ncbi:cytochrome c class i [Pontibacter diazotrophicus]|uniref:Cytochrome c class i n=1 Tax=Pontibacter diazotrophicus TaxID=1400979 RepID=A0A3D8L8E2_9BACT|nr:c-type cytochrome [Pontibacter diazotrophicus]RDV13566.1 cytochrome c class i [Pontibacter diazotrophicus]